MTLTEFRAAQGLTRVALAEMLGVAHSTVSRLEARKVEPSASLIRKIQKVTEGQVMPNDLFAATENAA